MAPVAGLSLLSAGITVYRTSVSISSGDGCSSSGTYECLPLDVVSWQYFCMLAFQAMFDISERVGRTSEQMTRFKSVVCRAWLEALATIASCKSRQPANTARPHPVPTPATP